MSLTDTNTIVRYLIQDDPALAAQANEFFDAVQKGTRKALILESVLAECVLVLSKIYAVPRASISNSLSVLLSFKGIVNDNNRELTEALNLYASTNLSIVDCILLEMATASGNALFTFDIQLGKLHFRRT